MIALRVFKRIHGGFQHRLARAHQRVVDLDDWTTGKDHGALNDVLQFTHVSRPVVVQQTIDRFLRQIANAASSVVNPVPRTHIRSLGALLLLVFKNIIPD